MLLGEGSELDDGKYRLLRLLDRGGMGSVFEAEHTRSKKRVAIKVLHPRRQGAAADTARIVREAQASGRVRHRNVVEVFDVSFEGDVCYLVMEYLEGETFRKVLDHDLPAHTLISLLLQAMRGVAAAHKQGVIHRDIKPENLFLAREEDAREPVMKVLDFGISKLVADGTQQALTLTATGAALGTPLYMPYEQVSGLRDIDARADVYAFGVVLYEALTRRLPYEGNGLVEVCCRMLESSPVPPEQLRPTLPTTLSNVVMWALAKEREARIPSMQRLIRELEPFATLRGMQAELSASADALEPDLMRAPAAVADSADISPTPSVALKPARASVATPGMGAGLQKRLQTLAMPGRRKVLLAALMSCSLAALLWLGHAGRSSHAPDLAPRRAARVAPAPSIFSVPAPAKPTQIAPEAEPHGDGEISPIPKRTGAPARASEARVAAATTRVPGAAQKPAALLSQAAARNAQTLERLKLQLVQCGALKTRAIREQCRNDHKREIAEYEEERELLAPLSDH